VRSGGKTDEKWLHDKFESPSLSGTTWSLMIPTLPRAASYALPSFPCRRPTCIRKRKELSESHLVLFAARVYSRHRLASRHRARPSPQQGRQSTCRCTRCLCCSYRRRRRI
jgi:hypothetical protein